MHPVQIKVDGRLNVEWVHLCRYQTRDKARSSIFYIEAFHNRCRLHPLLGYLSPEVYEKPHSQQVDLGLSTYPQN